MRYVVESVGEVEKYDICLQVSNKVITEVKKKCGQLTFARKAPTEAMLGMVKTLIELRNFISSEKMTCVMSVQEMLVREMGR